MHGDSITTVAPRGLVVSGLVTSRACACSNTDKGLTWEKCVERGNPASDSFVTCCLPPKNSQDDAEDVSGWPRRRLHFDRRGTAAAAWPRTGAAPRHVAPPSVRDGY
jgi:hypothetical protein